MQSLQTISAGFSERPMAASREMRSLLLADPARFADEALTLFRSDVSSTGAQNALTLLVTNNLILERLCEPQRMPLQAAIRLAKRIAENIDKSLDVKLARTLLPSNGAPPVISDRAGVVRVLEILSSVSDGSRIMTLLTQLLQHSDERVRSKVALLIGRINKNLKWVEQRMAEPDARVRANSIESLWGLDSPEARRVFLAAMKDRDNRVAGNGALGLYRCGDLSCAQALIRMLSHEDWKFRTTAAWSMGETEDPRFLPQLTPLIAEPEPHVRQNVFKAISRIRERVKRMAEAERLKIAITSSSLVHTRRRLTVAALDATIHPIQNLKATGFVVTDSGQVVNDFRFEESRLSEHLSVAFAIQRGLDQQESAVLNDALLAILRHKSKQDSWGIVRYLSKPATGRNGELALKPAVLSPGAGAVATQTAVLEAAPAADGADINFASDPQSLLATCESAGTRDSAAEDLQSALRQLISALAVQRGTRHIFFFVHQVAADGDWSVVERAAQDAHVALNGLVLGARVGRAMEDACRKSGGACMAVESPSTLPAACERIAMSLCAGYSIGYEPPAGSGGAVKIQVFSDRGFGEDTLA